MWWNSGGQNQWVTKSCCFHDYWWRHLFSWVKMFWTWGTTWAQSESVFLWIDVVVCKIQAILHACQPFPDIHVHMAPLALDSLSTKTVLELRISFSVYAWYLLSAEESDITNTRCTFKQELWTFSMTASFGIAYNPGNYADFFTVDPWLVVKFL